jgi:hypothetical protein
MMMKKKASTTMASFREEGPTLSLFEAKYDDGGE